MIYAAIFWRGFVIVFLTAANVRFISRRHYRFAFLTGFGISAVWWINAHAAAIGNAPRAWCVYGFGAAVGTVAGMAAANRLTRGPG